MVIITTFINVSRLPAWESNSEMERGPIAFALHVLSLPFVCGKTLAKNKFNQRSENMQRERITMETKL